jgi:23S rRNA (uracil1939-C5)-methyltransferase
MYSDFKINRVKALLKRENAEPLAYNPLIQIPPHTRRRSNFKVKKTHKNLILGFHYRRSHTVLPITMCPLLIPALAQLIQPLKSLCSSLLPVGGEADIFLLETKTGVDISLDSRCLRDLSLPQLEHLLLFCQEKKIARLRINGDLIVQHRQPVIEFSGVAVEVDAKSFCQVSDLSDRYLLEIVESYLIKTSSTLSSTLCEKTADLFCGRGAFTFLLAKRGAVDAYELEEEALIALNQANQQEKLRIKTQKRNLFSSPLTSQELDKYGVVLIDPPRAGALSQCHEISKSGCRSLIYVSCNPITFARDARILKEGGYSLISLTPVDQFLWTEHVEVVGLFLR